MVSVKVIRWILRHRDGMLSVWPKMPTYRWRIVLQVNLRVVSISTRLV